MSKSPAKCCKRIEHMEMRYINTVIIFIIIVFLFYYFANVFATLGQKYIKWPFESVQWPSVKAMGKLLLNLKCLKIGQNSVSKLGNIVSIIKDRDSPNSSHAVITFAEPLTLIQILMKDLVLSGFIAS